MVKEIGMRVGGPSESQVRGMRSEREIGGEGVRGGEETAHTFNKKREKKGKKMRDRMKKEEMREQQTS